MTAPADLLYDLDAARTDEQRAYMEELQADGICIFCPEHVGAHHAHPVEREGEHWYVTRNAYPYAGTTDLFLIPPKRHLRSLEARREEAGPELGGHRRWLKQRLAPVAMATVER